jgi:hypothetical protein
LKKAFFIRISLLVILGIIAYFWATGLMDSFYAYRSPLSANPPAAGIPVAIQDGSATPHRVVYVLIDGLRVDTALNAQVMPYLDKIRRQGAWAVMHSRPSSYSQTGYASLFTGAWPDISDGGLINLEPPEIFTWTQDNLFSAAQRAGLTTAIAGHEMFKALVPQGAVTALFYTPGIDRIADQEVLDAALPWLKSDGYDFILIHLDQVDYAGHHEGGPQDPRWNEAARRADDMLGQIAAELDFSKDVLFVSSDHGHIDTGGHGGHDEIVLQEPFALIGANVIPGDYGEVAMVDVAPTLAALLGVNLPAVSQGRVLIQMLDLSPQITANIQAATEAQQATLLTAYLKAIDGEPATIEPGTDPVAATESIMADQRQQRINREMVPRFLFATGLLFLPFIWMARKLRAELFWLLGGAVLYVLVFHLRYSLLNGRTYSLSSVSSADEIIIYVASTVAMAGFVGWLAALLDRGVFRLSPSQAALWSLNLSLVTVWLVSLPLLWSFVLNGLSITWTVPDFPSLFHGFLSLLQILFLSVMGIALAGIAAGVAGYQVRRAKNSTVME